MIFTNAQNSFSYKLVKQIFVFDFFYAHNIQYSVTMIHLPRSANRKQHQIENGPYRYYFE